MLLPWWPITTCSYPLLDEIDDDLSDTLIHAEPLSVPDDLRLVLERRVFERLVDALEQLLGGAGLQIRDVERVEVDIEPFGQLDGELQGAEAVFRAVDGHEYCRDPSNAPGHMNVGAGRRVHPIHNRALVRMNRE